MTIYMRVTRDKYRLPLALAETVDELARMCGVTRNAVSCSIYNSKKFGRDGEFVKVNVEDDNE